MSQVQPPIKPTVKLTPAQQLVISGLWSLLAAAATAGLSAVVQAYTTQGINVPVLINLGMIAFGGTFIKQALDYIPQHAKDMIQSVQDAYSELARQHSATLNTLSVVTTSIAQNNAVQPSQSLQPLVVIHSQAATQVAATSPDSFLTASPMAAQPTSYIPVVSQVPDVSTMTTQRVPAVTAQDLMAGVPDNSVSTFDPLTNAVTGQFRVAGLSNLPG